MSSRKKSTSTTESSSGSSSGSSSSSGTSSGSDSNSSSSDSESSSSQDATNSSRRNSNSGTSSNPNATSNDAKSSSTGSKKTAAPVPNASTTQPSRRVSDAKSSKTTSSAAPSNSQTSAQPDKSAPTAVTNGTGSNKNKTLPSKATNNRRMSSVKATDLSNSSEDDSPPHKGAAAAKKLAETKKKTAPLAQRAKTTAAAANSNKSSATVPPPSTGGKAPPAVVKQQQQQLHGLTKSNANKAGSGNIKAKPPVAKTNQTAPTPSKPPTKITNSPSNTVSSNVSSKTSNDKTNTIKTNDADDKKKSIFSPDNSTESDGSDGSDGSDDDDTDNDSVSTKQTNSTTSAPPKPKSAPSAAAVLVGGKTKPPVRPKGRPPPAKSKTTEKVVDKSSAESSVASTSTSTDDATTSSDSDSEESSADSTPPSKRPPNRRVPPKSTATRPTNSNKSPESKDNVNSESDIENKSDPKIIRKLTRSSSTRKSKHLTAIFNPGKASESETESETKRSTTKSPVKRAPVTKGKSKNSKTNTKNSHISSPVKRTPTVPEERHCLVDGCNSMGHLGGRLEKHFTEEACPLFHGVSLADTKTKAEEHLKRADDRKKATILFDPEKKQVTVEQKTYQLKIRDVRNKFTPVEVSPVRTSIAHNHHREREYREPSLTGLVSDYDLQLFREAQEVASEKIEDELKDLPAGKGTKYILMGRHNMEVWYQSPYPDDAARLPKLYLCEFCLRYQKSEVGMKRHAAKCVWRHPPGDEIYRKQKLGVWQVDGKRHKQYCQHLCLLAKFFLDHKTLYYDVEPFLFYVMTLADSEGCHTVGYFSKEKNSFLNYNVSCILTLPPYQRKGYGRLLIDFSYLLTRVEGKIGSPEKPLSDLGLISYRSYWKDVLLDYLCSRSGTSLSIKDVSQEMAINSYDIVSTLQALGMMKYWKGKHIILKKQDVLEEYEERIKSRGAVIKIDPTCLRWTPFVLPAPPGPS